MFAALTRLALVAGFAALAMPALADPAQNGPWQHGTSLIGQPKYPEGFKHYDYVNPQAPKGGTVRLSSIGGFDTFNPILSQGEPADGLGLVYEPLMDRSLDEVSAEYGLLADAVAFPPDISSATFRMNPKAKWQDGTPVTAQDVVWSFNELIKLNASQAQYYHDVTKAEVTAPDQVTFYFDVKNNRELPNILGQLLVLPQHWWEGKDASGKQRNIAGSSLEPPMGSGPYKIASFNPGSSVTYQRDPNYWAKNEPTGIGQDNVDQIRYIYFRDPDVAFEAFKGDQFDWWSENRARRWATGYDFPAVADKRVLMELYPQTYADSGIMVGFVPNLRLPKFRDPRVREALNYAFDFEQLNKTLFYNQYQRVNSYFYGTPLASSGLPTGAELQILNSVKDKIPASVFTTPYTNPVGGDSTKLRANLRQALNLLTQAGYTLSGNQLVDKNGQQLSFEILLDGPTIEPVASAFAHNLKAIGINATLRSVDSAQYINRLRSRDFDMIYAGWAESMSPGNEQRDFWSCGASKDPDTTNYGGICDPGIDALVDKVVFAKDRDTLIAATRALDRVLLAGHYVVPSYTLRNDRIAHWDRFSHAATLPAYNIGFPQVWWYDEAKAQKTGVAQ
ncbi:MAG TPA: extracellular solute-binding protein [Devosiaceae bacterium]|nr:extracellular solute-binding protein [Devosiaceae bacterium]